MEWLTTLLDLFLHLDRHLATLSATYGIWIYAILFAVIFAETGFVITPFLPGDSLLFVAGSLAALSVGDDANQFGGIHIHTLVVLLFVAAVLGNTLNYEIGRWLGPKVFSQRESRWLNPSHIERTNQFFTRFGGLAVVIARFIPLLRTYVPFVAGIGAMRRQTYLTYTIIGAALWVGSITYLGFFFGNIAWVKTNLGFLMLAIIVASVLPMVVSIVRIRWRLRSAARD
jgi:membrane-associated protein